MDLNINPPKAARLKIPFKDDKSPDFWIEVKSYSNNSSQKYILKS